MGLLMTFEYRKYTILRTEEIFGDKNLGEWILLQNWAKKLWQMDRVGRKNFSFIAMQMPACISNWRNGDMVQPKHMQYKKKPVWILQLHITISEMDTPLSGTWMQLMPGVWHTKMYNIFFNRITQHSASVKDTLETFPQTIAFTLNNLADREMEQ